MYSEIHIFAKVKGLMSQWKEVVLLFFRGGITFILPSEHSEGSILYLQTTALLENSTSMRVLGTSNRKKALLSTWTRTGSGCVEEAQSAEYRQVYCT